MNQQNYEGLTALYEALQAWSLETEEGKSGPDISGKRSDRERSGAEQLAGLIETMPATWSGNEIGWRDSAGETSRTQQTQSASVRQWLGQENSISGESLSVQSLSRAVELDARRYDGQIGRCR